MGIAVARPQGPQQEIAMPAPTIRPAADPLDDIDRATTGADSAMGRQDRADLPGERSDRPNAGHSGDKYIDATRAVSEGAGDTDQAILDDHEGSRVILDEDADLGMARESLKPAEPPRGADDDDPIDETERAGDDAIR
jgi:hypothetical protein